MMNINISSRTLLACLNKSKPSDGSRPDDDGCLPGVAIEIACGVGDFEGSPRIPKRLIADGASGISCCILLALNSPSGKGGGAEGFGIGGADGRSIVKPSELTDGDTTTERDLGVEGTLLEDELDDELGGAGGLKYAGASGSNPG
jgi:hypothetical protein